MCKRLRPRLRLSLAREGRCRSGTWVCNAPKSKTIQRLSRDGRMYACLDPPSIYPLFDPEILYPLFGTIDPYVLGYFEGPGTVPLSAHGLR